jgi:hypothetical protein
MWDWLTNWGGDGATGSPDGGDPYTGWGGGAGGDGFFAPATADLNGGGDPFGLALDPATNTPISGTSWGDWGMRWLDRVGTLAIASRFGAGDGGANATVYKDPLTGKVYRAGTSPTGAQQPVTGLAISYEKIIVLALAAGALYFVLRRR